MKTYVLIVSRFFPANHPKAGQKTRFLEKILDAQKQSPFPNYSPIKIHTIRANYDLWDKRFEKINTGEACLSLRYWSGKPYRSNTVEFLRLDKSNGIGIEKLDFDRFLGIFINSIDSDVELSTIAKNDGLSLSDFKNWFNSYNLNEPMAIIHFTGFRYCV